MAVESPCVRNCCLDGDDICLGCFRTVDEIIFWGDATSDERSTILEKSSGRKQKRSEEQISRDNKNRY